MLGLANPNPIPNPNPEQVRACRYDSTNEGVYGSGVLCEAHNDVGFLTPTLALALALSP